MPLSHRIDGGWGAAIHMRRFGQPQRRCAARRSIPGLEPVPVAAGGYLAPHPARNARARRRVWRPCPPPGKRRRRLNAPYAGSPSPLQRFVECFSCIRNGTPAYVTRHSASYVRVFPPFGDVPTPSLVPRVVRLLSQGSPKTRNQYKNQKVLSKSLNPNHRPPRRIWHPCRAGPRQGNGVDHSTVTCLGSKLPYL